ncbi:MAG TPA: F0F1 ATP synthase subunit A [Pyrinomonadaceae bacterium]|nr:F0F1 ATP synthase subunit A [Pyrinomonadaceae bacterium]
MMFWLFNQETAGHAGQAAEHGAKAAEHGGGAAHHTPVIVEFVNHWIGEPVHHFQVAYTKPLWDKFFALFHTNAETVFGPYTPETAVPWYTVMFVIACILSVVVIWILRGQLSDDDPSGGQMTLEAGILAVRGLLQDVVGPHGLQYFPVVATFGVLILVSNLMAFIPGLLPPTAATSVTFALGLTSFFYYNYVGIKENGVIGHFKHFMGPVLAIAPLLFLIELISNLVRPMSLGIRLFGNIFADEQVVSNISGLFPPYTYWLIPVFLMPLGLFVAIIQTFVFVFLSMVYISEVSHPPHEGHEHDEHGHGAYEHVEGQDAHIVGQVTP